MKGRSSVSLSIFAKPVPASRPRVSKWGTYYGKNYNAWRKEAERLLQEHRDEFQGPLAVFTEVVAHKPKTTKRLYPLGDNDNYEKAVWDSITNSECGWKDDDQIILNLTHKRFVEAEEECGVHLTIYELETV